MRTIRVELVSQADATTSLAVSTEVIVPDDADVGEAGREARTALDGFINGYIEEPGR